MGMARVRDGQATLQPNDESVHLWARAEHRETQPAVSAEPITRAEFLPLEAP